MKIVVDTNIVFSAILNSQSWIGQILLHSDKTVKFYSPRYLQTEIQNHIQKIKKHTNLSDSEIDELIDALYTKISFISEEFIPKEILIVADELTRDVDYDDVMFVALAIHLRCKLWTGDKILMNTLKQKGFKRFIATNELKDKLKK
jgi:putative PIN family toxin of toxin-antitoxin system